MERIIINTGLSGFVMPERIISCTENSIQVEKAVADPDYPEWLLIETCAQTAAIHTRIGVDFEKHAFLLTIDRFEKPEKRLLAGDYLIKAVRKGNAGSAYRYLATGVRGGKKRFSCTLITALTDYSDGFDRQRLSRHYREIVSCLMKNS